MLAFSLHHCRQPSTVLQRRLGHLHLAPLPPSASRRQEEARPHHPSEGYCHREAEPPPHFDLRPYDAAAPCHHHCLLRRCAGKPGHRSVSPANRQSDDFTANPSAAGAPRRQPSFPRRLPPPAPSRVDSTVSEDRAREKKSLEDCLKKQGKSHIPLKHVEPNLLNVLSFSNKLHVLLITQEQGLLICSVVPYLLDIYFFVKRG